MMIGKLLFPIMLIAVVILGGVGADFLRTSSGGGDVSHASAKDDHAKPGKKAKDDHGKKDDGHAKKKKKKKKGGHGEEDDAGAAPGTMSYLTFKRQFVVPVVKSGKIESLVLLNLNLELNEEAPADVHTFEPKLRDAIMRALLSLSHDGAFTGDLTNTETYDQIRDNLLASVKRIITDGVESVLILDISRQDQ